MLVAGLVVLILLGSSKAEEDEAEEKKNSAIISCGNGWFPFENMCYKLGGRNKIVKMSFDQADKECMEYGGRLATIYSQALNDYLVAYLLLPVRVDLWIGLRRDLVHNSTYDIWQDGSALAYTNWEPQEPSFHYQMSPEHCAEMIFHSWKESQGGRGGMWNDNDCKMEKEFICQKKKEIQTRKIDDPRFCPDGGWRYESSCFSLVDSNNLTWDDAEQFCVSNFNGHLTSVSDKTVNMFLNYVLPKKRLWIGIKIKEGLQQLWSNGWFVAKENWAEDRNTYPIGTCAVYSDNGQWSAVPCSGKLPFVCETSERPGPSSVINKDLEGWTCPEYPQGWRDLGLTDCYFFDVYSWITWFEANFMCMRRGGTLASIHSKTESDILQQFVKYTQKRLHIGLYRHMQKDEEFAWSDGSPVDYLGWDPDEPTTKNKQCAELWTHNMGWRNEDCGIVMGFICSTPKLPPNTTTGHLQKSAPLCSSCYSINSVVGMGFCIIFLSVLVGLVIYYFRLCEREPRKKRSDTIAIVPPPATYRNAGGSTSPDAVHEIVVKDYTYENLMAQS